uniref:Germacrene A acid 8-beta-hydroxylase n=1 Tax=Inula hupehensis TaxID=1805964 RepID=C7BL6_INUHU|nr:RecName: Full=Germacrene A acid 8-beta-hydroxylase; Short=Ih8H; Short=IhG8H; AltName: Full=Cytochrome P450 71BL6; AltName: Full=Germacrene A acid 8-alpha-hydroxylase [Inula hupehensis]AML23863.1 germacrene A acid 8-hydroxylase [Inula hupehensis]
MEPFTTFSLVASSLILLICWALVKANKPAKNLPPGPPKLPIIGNMHQLESQSPHRVLRKLSRKYGPIMHLQLGQVPTVVISTPRLVEEVVKHHDINFADRPTNTTSQIFYYNNQNVAWSSYGNYWRQIKKIVTLELLSVKKVRSFSSIRAEELTRAVKSVEPSVGSTINFRDLTSQTVNNMVSRATLGDVCKERHILLDTMNDILKTFNSFNVVNFFPSLQFLNVITGKKAKWLKIHKQLDHILENILEEHKSKPKGNQDDEDLIDVLLRVKDAGGQELPITNDNVKAITLEMLTAGTSSSSMTIEWAFCELMRHPEVMKKVQSDVRSAVKGNKVTEDDIQNMHYLKLVVKETLRLHGVPILVPRQNREDCNVLGYHIPAKTKILINAWACGTDPDTWEDPESFIPERFEKSSVSYFGTDFQLIPFGTGRRICPGVNFGIGTVEAVLSNFLYHFDWKLPDGVKPQDIDMTEVTGISTLPKYPLHIVPVSTVSQQK